GRHPLSDVRFDTERDLDVSSRHAAIVRHGAAFSLRDLGSKNGTFVNGERITGDVVLQDGDVIGFGPQGPSVEFRVLAAEGERDAVTGSRERRASAALRLVAELAHLRRTTKVLIGLLGLTLAGFAWSQWEAARDARALVALRARADSLHREAQRLLSRFQSELESVRDALRESQAEVARPRARYRRSPPAGPGGRGGGRLPRDRPQKPGRGRDARRQVLGCRGVHRHRVRGRLSRHPGHQQARPRGRSGGPPTRGDRRQVLGLEAVVPGPIRRRGRYGGRRGAAGRRARWHAAGVRAPRASRWPAAGRP